MKFAFLLLTILILTPVSGFAQADSTAAQRAVAEQRFSDARVIYSRLLTNEPENLEYRIWVARLSSWLGDYKAALENYNLALLKDPTNTDALVGRAYVHMWRQERSEAARDLDSAEKAGAKGPDLIMARARFLYYQDKWSQAYQLLGKVLDADPSNTEAAELKTRLQSRAKYELRLGTAGETLSNDQSSFAGVISARWISRRNSLAVNFESWKRFGQNSNRAGLAWQHSFGNGMTLTAEAMFAPGSTVLARQDFSVALRKPLKHGFTASTELRTLRFGGPSVVMVSPSLEYHFEAPAWISFTYHLSRSRFTPALSNLGGSYQVSYNHQAGGRLTLHGGYQQGSETFTTATIDHLGTFRSKTIQAGADLAINQHLGVNFSYSKQFRSNGIRQDSLGVTFILRK